MTINWCLKRAEMVFKSVKGSAVCLQAGGLDIVVQIRVCVCAVTDSGFMLENSSWRGNQSWNIQFLIPEVHTLSNTNTHIYCRLGNFQVLSNEE